MKTERGVFDCASFCSLTIIQEESSMEIRNNANEWPFNPDAPHWMKVFAMNLNPAKPIPGSPAMYAQQTKVEPIMLEMYRLYSMRSFGGPTDVDDVERLMAWFDHDIEIPQGEWDFDERRRLEALQWYLQEAGRALLAMSEQEQKQIAAGATTGWIGRRSPSWTLPPLADDSEGEG